MYMSVKTPLEFVKKHIKPHFLKSTRLSTKGKGLIQSIVSQILAGQKAWTTAKVQHTVLAEFPKGNSFPHIVKEIRDEIESSPKIGKQYSFMIGKRVFHIYAIYPYSHSHPVSPEQIYKLLDESVIQIYIWLFVAMYFIGGNSQCSPELTLYWYLTDWQKKIPETGEIALSEINANTGFTMACPRVANSIYVYRKEEWFKVFVHETIHSFGIDFALMSEEYDKSIFEMFGIHCDLRLYEAYTETWAEIIQAIFFCMTPPTEVVEVALNHERMFSLFQKAKILEHHQLTYRELYTKTGGVRYKEETPVFSYFILKCILMFHYSEFIDWCAENNGGTFVFQKTRKNLAGFVEFIRAHYQTPEYIRAVEHYEEWFSRKRNKRSHKGKHPYEESLRMSVSSRIEKI